MVKGQGVISKGPVARQWAVIAVCQRARLACFAERQEAAAG